jgi:hypothetical protein
MRPAEQEPARHRSEQSTLPGTALWLLHPPVTSNFRGMLRRLNQSAKPRLSIRKHQSIGNHQSGRRHPTGSRSAIAFRKSPHQPAVECVRPRSGTSPGNTPPLVSGDGIRGHTKRLALSSGKLLRNLSGTHHQAPLQEPLGDTPSGTTERVSVSPDGIASLVVAGLRPKPKQAIFSDFCAVFSRRGHTTA